MMNDDVKSNIKMCSRTQKKEVNAQILCGLIIIRIITYHGILMVLWSLQFCVKLPIYTYHVYI